LNVDLNGFQCFCQEHIKRNFALTSNNVYLNIKHVRKENKEEQVHEQQKEENPTVLAINVEGGFKDEEMEEMESYEELLSLVCLDPINKVIPLPNIDLPEKVCILYYISQFVDPTIDQRCFGESICGKKGRY
jgi:hypothetical protein